MMSTCSLLYVVIGHAWPVVFERLWLQDMNLRKYKLEVTKTSLYSSGDHDNN